MKTTISFGDFPLTTIPRIQGLSQECAVSQQLGRKYGELIANNSCKMRIEPRKIKIDHQTLTFLLKNNWELTIKHGETWGINQQN
jgi:hypothetical protein